MKNHDNNFKDFVCLLTLFGIASAFSEKDDTDKPKTETKTAEKKCDCTEKTETKKPCKCIKNCKNHEEFYAKDIDEFLKKGIRLRGDQIIYLPKIKKEEILKAIDKCFEIINNNSDVNFHRIGGHLLDVIYILSQYK